MIIHQFYDKGLAHASYALIRLGKMIVIDPARDPQPYYEFAAFNSAGIVGVIETHPHADFISSHLEIHQTTGATIYVSKLLGAGYPHETFDDGDVIQLADIKLKAINTPGHSPDSICVLVQDENGNDKVIFTGDTLFVGDVGRPDLRENAGNIHAAKEKLARQLYHAIHEKLMVLPRQVTVYPAHGPGSLCGKNLSADLQSTIGRELRENYALKLMDERTFVEKITADQPFIPKYFGHDVELNRRGAGPFAKAVAAVPRLKTHVPLPAGAIVIDTRGQHDFKNGHIKGAINIQDSDKFETWLGSIVDPQEAIYLVAENVAMMDVLIKKAAKIGYEKNIAAALLNPSAGLEKSAVINLADDNFKPENYTIIDVRNWGEINLGKIFKHAIAIPLPELREWVNEIPVHRPIVVHCAAGYRSAAAASIIAGKITSVPVYDLGEAVTSLGSLKPELQN